LELFSELKAFTKDPDGLYEQFKKLIHIEDELKFEMNWISFLDNFSNLQKPQIDYLEEVKLKKEKWCKCYTHHTELFMHDSFDRNRYVFDIMTKSLHKFKSDKMSQIIEAVRLVKVITYHFEPTEIDSFLLQTPQRALFNHIKTHLEEEYSTFPTSLLFQSLLQTPHLQLSPPFPNQSTYSVSSSSSLYSLSYPSGHCSCLFPISTGLPCSHLLKVILFHSHNSPEAISTFIHPRWQTHSGLSVVPPDKPIEDVLEERKPTVSLRDIGVPTRFNRWKLDKRMRAEKWRRWKGSRQAGLGEWVGAVPFKGGEYINRRRKEKAERKTEGLTFSEFNFD
jgi:hypothetical protein